MACKNCGTNSSYSSSYSSTTSSNGTTTTTSTSSSTTTSSSSLSGRTFGSYRVKNGYNGAYGLQHPETVNRIGVKRKSRADESLNLSLAEQAYFELNKKYQR